MAQQEGRLDDVRKFRGSVDYIYVLLYLAQ